MRDPIPWDDDVRYHYKRDYEDDHYEGYADDEPYEKDCY